MHRLVSSQVTRGRCAACGTRLGAICTACGSTATQAHALAMPRCACCGLLIFVRTSDQFDYCHGCVPQGGQHATR